MSLYPRTYHATCFKEMAHFCVCSLPSISYLQGKCPKGSGVPVTLLPITLETQVTFGNRLDRPHSKNYSPQL